MAVDTRERIIEASAELFRRQGYAGTGVKGIASAARAPFGSLYHFFPAGRKSSRTPSSGGPASSIASSSKPSRTLRRTC